jgi:hypothetical protein
MDVGVGGFIFSTSLTACQARRWELERSSWLAAVKRMAPVALVGVGRLLFVKAINYPVRVRELLQLPWLPGSPPVDDGPLVCLRCSGARVGVWRALELLLHADSRFPYA